MLTPLHPLCQGLNPRGLTVELWPPRGGVLLHAGGEGAVCRLQACPSSRYQPDQQFSRNEKTGVDLTEVTCGPEAGAQEPAPEAGMADALASLWSPKSAVPTPQSGRVVYECALLLGEPWTGSGSLRCREEGGVAACGGISADEGPFFLFLMRSHGFLERGELGWGFWGATSTGERRRDRMPPALGVGPAAQVHVRESNP